MPAAARIVAQDWGFRYPGRAAAALSGVSFDVAAGELVVLMGASGSGKSTLLAGLAETLPEGGASGRLEVLMPEGAGSAGGAGAVTGRVGLVQQEPEGNVVMELVGDDVAFPLECAAVPRAEIWPQVGAALAAVGLDVGWDRSTARLSGGQQQLLAIAAASVARPGLLLLDEPTANLDPDAAARVLDAVTHVRTTTGCTVVVVEHRVEPWLAQADRLLLAEAGSITVLAPGELAAHLAGRPEQAARVWVDHAHLPDRGPTRPPGDTMVQAVGVAVAGRLTTTDLVVRSGEALALTGPPGSGKSTLLACLGGLLEPSAGSVSVRTPAGPRVDPWRWPSPEVAATFGAVFQNPEHQFVTGRVIDELAHGLIGAGHGPELATSRATAMLGRLHLGDLAQADPFTLSGGEQRRLSVGTALVLDPGILLLDEPTFGQDPATWAEVVDIIATHRDAGGSVVLATHDPDLVRCLRAREIHMRPCVAPGDPAPGSGVAPGSLSTPGPAGPEYASGPGPELVSGPGPESGSGASAIPARGLRSLDPLALVGAVALLSTGALLSGSVALNLALAAFAVAAALVGGLPARHVALLAAPAALAAASVAFSNALLGASGIASVEAWTAAALPASRVLAVALPGLVAAVGIDPTALADALVVRLRVPARAGYSVLAGLRLLPLLADEWTILGRASRARGLGGSGAAVRARRFGSMTFRLLVAALRRGGRLAIALDARGLRSEGPRTFARPLTWRIRDSAALAVGVAALVAAVATRVG
jgi:energy-coupling factor transport system ATP-binding protein